MSRKRALSESKITVTYGITPMQPHPLVTISLGKPRIPYVGRIVGFIVHPFVWFPLWLGLAVLAWRLFT